MHALGVQIERQGDDVHIAGALAVAKQAAFHPVGPGHDAQFSGGNSRAPVVVRVQAQDNAVAPRQIAVHPFHLVGVDIGRSHFYGSGQIQNHFVGGRGAPDGGDGVAHFLGKFQLGACEQLGAVLQHPLSLGVRFGELLDQRDRIHRHLHHFGLTHVEHHIPKQGRGSVVYVHDDAPRTHH